MLRGRGSEEDLKTLAQTYRPDTVDRASKNQALTRTNELPHFPEWRHAPEASM